MTRKVWKGSGFLLETWIPAPGGSPWAWLPSLHQLCNGPAGFRSCQCFISSLHRWDHCTATKNVHSCSAILEHFSFCSVDGMSMTNSRPEAFVFGNAGDGEWREGGDLVLVFGTFFLEQRKGPKANRGSILCACRTFRQTAAGLLHPERAEPQRGVCHMQWLQSTIWTWGEHMITQSPNVQMHFNPFAKPRRKGWWRILHVSALLSWKWLHTIWKAM